MISLLDRAGNLLASALLVTLLATGSSGAEPTYSFAATPGKLPKTVVPVHYALDLQPDLDQLTLTGAELVEPPWGDDEWNERRAAVEEVGSLFVRWPELVPQLLEWADRTIDGG